MSPFVQESVCRHARQTIEGVAGMLGKEQNVGNGERWLSSLVGSGLVLAGLKRGSLPGALLTLGGGLLVYRGLSGRCHVYKALGIETAERRRPLTGVPAQYGYKIEESLLINRPVEEVFRYWRHLENLPQMMRHLVRVESMGENRSRWIAKGPMGSKFEWEAEIHNEQEGRLIAWRSLPGSQVDTAGSVHFDPGPGGRGTRLKVSLKYDPPAGKPGAVIAMLLGDRVERDLHEDLRRFKQVMEGGEVLTTAGQPVGGQSA